MSIKRDLAVTLRVIPFSNTSSIVSWFSAERGRIATLAKGAQRPRSPFLGQTDLFYTCEILYYQGYNIKKLPVLKECAPLKTRAGFRAEWRAMLCASYITLLIERLCPAQAPYPSLFHLLETTLDMLVSHTNRSALLFWFELRVLSAMGLAPKLNGCTRCGKITDSNGESTMFSAAAGGLTCEICRNGTRPDGIAIAPDVLALLLHWQNTSDPAYACRAIAQSSQVKSIEKALGAFLRHHLDILHPGRALALRHAEIAKMS